MIYTIKIKKNHWSVGLKCNISLPLVAEIFLPNIDNKPVIILNDYFIKNIYDLDWSNIYIIYKL